MPLLEHKGTFGVFLVLTLGYMVYILATDQRTQWKRTVSSHHKPNVSVCQIGNKSQSKSAQEESGAPSISVIFYNRIEKTGSETTAQLLQKLSHVNHINVKFDIQPLPQHAEAIHMFPNATQEGNFVAKVLRFRRPLIYIKHLYYLNFSSYQDEVKPVYINIVRDPIDRAISSYNYQRYRKDRPHSMGAERRHRSMDECIASNATECAAPQYTAMYVRSFCGSKPICMTPSQGALQQAKHNIDKHYIVVGMLERLEDFYRVLEVAAPSYFKGLPSLYKENKNSTKAKHKWNRTLRKDTPGEMSRAMFRERLKYDYNLYEYIKQKFDSILRVRTTI